MTSWRKSIHPGPPLRNVTLVRGGALPSDAVARVALTEEDVEAARRSGYEAGRAEGERSLGEKVERQRADSGERILSVLDSMRRAVRQVITETEHHLVALALDIARKLVTDLPVTVEMVEGALREALVEVEGATEIHVRLHPADLELLKEKESGFLAPTGAGAEIQFHGATEVSRGGCLVQTQFGVIDGRRETRFDLLKKSLLE